MKAVKNYGMKLEVAGHQCVCARCGKEIITGSVFMRFGVFGETLTDFCPDCFEDMSRQLSDDFQSLRSSGKMPLEMPPSIAPLEIRCFTCGQKPEHCRCGREAYR